MKVLLRVYYISIMALLVWSLFPLGFRQRETESTEKVFEAMKLDQCTDERQEHRIDFSCWTAISQQ